MPKRFTGLAFIVIFLVCVTLPWNIVHADKSPITPSVFLGDHQQAAIILDNVWESSRYDDQMCPSIIIDIWYDGDRGLYFITAPEPLRIWQWIIGENNIRLIAIQDDEIADFLTLAKLIKNGPKESANTFPNHFTISEGALVYTENEKFIPISIFEVIDAIIALPDDMIAIVSFSEGISIMNTKLTISAPLRIDPWPYANNRLLRCFEMANPDIPLFYTQSRNMLTGLVFGTVLPLHIMLRDYPGEVDVFCASIEEAEAARLKGRIMDLSVSIPILDTVSHFYPNVKEALQREGFLTGIPIDINPRLWSIQYGDWLAFGEAAIPRTFDELTKLLFGRPYENSVLIMAPDGNGEVYADWMMSQYIAQYARETEPLNFDTPIFKDILKTAREYENQRYFMNDESYVVDLIYDWGLPWSSGVKGFLPPAFIPQEDIQVYTDMNVWCVDGSTPNITQSFRFLEFQLRYTDPAYSVLLVQTEIQQSKKEVLSIEQPYDEIEILLFYAYEMAPRLRLIFGGMYEDLDAQTVLEKGELYSREGHGFSSITWKYINGELDDVNVVAEELNQMALKQYNLWHEDCLDLAFDE